MTPDSDFDVRAVYDKEIKPLVDALIAKCDALGVPGHWAATIARTSEGGQTTQCHMGQSDNALLGGPVLCAISLLPQLPGEVAVGLAEDVMSAALATRLPGFMAKMLADPEFRAALEKGGLPVSLWEAAGDVRKH